MEPDGKEDEEGVPQICRKGDEKKPSLGVFVMGLQVLGATHPEPVHCIHHSIHVVELVKSDSLPPPACGFYTSRPTTTTHGQTDL